VWHNPKFPDIFVVRVEERDNRQTLSLSNFWAGNIILDVVIVQTENLNIGNMNDIHQLRPTDSEMAEKSLAKAQQKGLTLMEINPSYGAECRFLFKSAEILPGHVLAESNATSR